MTAAGNRGQTRRARHPLGSLEANVQVAAQLPALEADGADALVRAHLDTALGAAAGETVATGRSESFALPDQPTEVRDLALFAFVEGLDGHGSRGWYGVVRSNRTVAGDGAIRSR